MRRDIHRSTATRRYRPVVLRRRHLQAVEERLHRLERRVDDTDDTVAAALGPDRVDDLWHRVEELGVSAVTHDDVLQLRMEAANLRAEITKVRSELHAELDRLAAVVDDLSEADYPKRAFG